ncbi:Multidrug resistance-associated protein 9 [Frankliniella fusca]|uniref:Multidrug resistance-associated protein 9 n=1 Tax=Frankliniella fusca TaxID=407009 RepID=A0AAE1GXA3_9NEOP|nr:Multidrug resistance-associated protein 9 [Frankliniella fusca]
MLRPEARRRSSRSRFHCGTASEEAEAPVGLDRLSAMLSSASCLARLALAPSWEGGLARSERRPRAAARRGPNSAHLLLHDDETPVPQDYPPRRGWWPLLVACAPCFGSWRGLVARAALGWLSPAVWKAFRGEDVDSSAFVNESQSSLTDSLRLLQLLRVSGAAGAGPSTAGGIAPHRLGHCLWAFVRGRLIAACLLGVVAAVGSVASPVLLIAALIRAMDDSPADQVPAVLWATGFAVCELLTCLLTSGASSIATRQAGRLRAAMQGLMYRKVIRLNSCSDLLPHQVEAAVLTVGTPLWRAVEHAPQLVVAPLVILLSVCASCILIGESAIVAAAAFLFAAMIQTIATGLSSRLRSRAHAVFSTWRRQRTFELLSLAAHAKAFMVESALIRRIRELRRAESVSLRLASTVDSLCRTLLPSAVPAATVAIALHPTFNPETSAPAVQVYPVLILLLVQMEAALRGWGQAVNAVLEARSSLDHLKAVLSMDEAKPHPGQPIDRLVALSFNNASFSWSPSGFGPADSEPRLGPTRIPLGACSNVLTAVHIVVNKGQLVGVCGRAGAGKSALLLAASGQLRLTAGQLHRDESTAYVGEAAALLPGSVRDNVTMRGALHSQRYYRALHCTGLERDVQAMPTGDDTLVDTTRLTPAQLQRLALARAVYADRETYLLDDPLSALDAAAADRIFESAILGELKGKTVILVTNREQHLRHCEEVYVLREGRVLERGAPADLAESGREYPHVIDSNSREEQWWALREQPEVTRGMERARDSDDEDVSGTGAWSELRAVAAECGATPGRLALLALPLLLQSAMYADMLLCFWLALLQPRPPLLVLGFLMAASMVVALAFLRTFTVTQALLGQSRRVHGRWVDRLGCATTDFLRAHATQLRLALEKHTWLLDAGLPRALAGVAAWTPLVVFEMALLALASRWAAVAMLGLLLPAALLVTYVATAAGLRMWQRERACRASLRQLVGASYSSRAAVLSLGREDDMVARFSAVCDQAATDLVHAVSLPAWLAVRLRAGAVVAGLVTLVAQIWAPPGMGLPPVLPPGPGAEAATAAAGSFVSGIAAGPPPPPPGPPPPLPGAALGMTALLLCLIGTHLTRAATAALRARSHLAAAAEARDLVNRAEVEDETLCVKGGAECDDPSLNWPSLTDAGGLVLRDLWRPPELRALTARVKLGECMGVLGPPSAVLGAVLLRFVRPSAGCVLVSGADIADVPLGLLRAAVVVVPPRPSLFKGTLRWNMDPHGIWSDAQLWEALERTGLRELVASLDRKLLTPVGTHAARCPLIPEPEDLQLLCLARAALRDWAKVVLLEAPAGPRVLAAARKLFPQSAIVVAARGPTDVAQCSNVLQIAA